MGWDGEFVWVVLKTNKTFCQRWPFINGYGYIKTDSSFVEFKPWENDQDYWGWDIKTDSVLAIKKCT